MTKRLALADDGQIVYCREPSRCAHTAHQDGGEAPEAFLKRLGLSKTNNNKSFFLAKKLWDQNIYIGMKMENRNMTFPQTKDILDGINTGEVALDDIQAVLDNRDAWKELFASIYEKNDISYAARLEGIAAGHEALVPGKLRTGKVYISGTDYIPPVPDEEKVTREYEQLTGISDVKERAAALFLYICRNQLFWDGNKRTALLIANKELISENAGVLCIDTGSISEFNRLLGEFYDTGSESALKAYLISQIKEI